MPRHQLSCYELWRGGLPGVWQGSWPKNGFLTRKHMDWTHWQKRQDSLNVWMIFQLSNWKVWSEYFLGQKWLDSLIFYDFLSSNSDTWQLWCYHVFLSLNTKCVKFSRRPPSLLFSVVDKYFSSSKYILIVTHAEIGSRAGLSTRLKVMRTCDRGGSPVPMHTHDWSLNNNCVNASKFRVRRLQPSKMPSSSCLTTQDQRFG